MYTVYGAGLSPFVRKVLVVMAEKGLDYQLEPIVPINVSAEFKQISPLGKIPALRDGERTLSDSSVICTYLDRKHPSPALYPEDPYDHARALWFEEYADTALVQTIGPKIFFPLIVAPVFMNQQPDHEAVRKTVSEDLPPLLDYLESQLGDGAFVVGDTLSIGDVAIGSQMINLELAGFPPDAARWPKLASYLAGLGERPSFATLIAEDRATLNPGK